MPVPPTRIWFVTPEEIAAFCRQRLATNKVPRIVQFIDEIPKTPSGKFLRRALRG